MMILHRHQHSPTLILRNPGTATQSVTSDRLRASFGVENLASEFRITSDEICRLDGVVDEDYNKQHHSNSSTVQSSYLILSVSYACSR
jgi:hypothetical protein